MLFIQKVLNVTIAVFTILGAISKGSMTFRCCKVRWLLIKIKRHRPKILMIITRMLATKTIK